MPRGNKQQFLLLFAKGSFLNCNCSVNMRLKILNFELNVRNSENRVISMPMSYVLWLKCRFHDTIVTTQGIALAI